MATFPTDAGPFPNIAEQLHHAASDATKRPHSYSPLVTTTQDGHLDNNAACPAERSCLRETTGYVKLRRPSSTDIPLLLTDIKPRSPTQENSPTRYEEYLRTRSGRKPQKTEKVKAAGGWKRLHACARPQVANGKSSRRHRGTKKPWRLRLQAPARNQFLDKDGYVEFPDIGRLAKLTTAEQKELDEAIRLSK